MQIDQDQVRALVEKLTEGRGGAFFYYSHDRWRTPPPPEALFALAFRLAADAAARARTGVRGGAAAAAVA